MNTEIPAVLLDALATAYGCSRLEAAAVLDENARVELDIRRRRARLEARAAVLHRRIREGTL